MPFQAFSLGETTINLKPQPAKNYKEKEMAELTKTSNGYNAYEWEEVFPCDVADDAAAQNVGDTGDVTAQPTPSQGLQTNEDRYVSDVMTW